MLEWSGGCGRGRGGCWSCREGVKEWGWVLKGSGGCERCLGDCWRCRERVEWSGRVLEGSGGCERGRGDCWRCRERVEGSGWVMEGSGGCGRGRGGSWRRLEGTGGVKKCNILLQFSNFSFLVDFWPKMDVYASKSCFFICLSVLQHFTTDLNSCWSIFGKKCNSNSC